MTLEEGLRRKGWEEHEIGRVMDIMYTDHKREKHQRYSAHGNRVLYWTDLFILTIGNFMIAVILIPFLLALKSAALYLIVATLGFVFGILFAIMVRDIESIERKHHIFAAIYIPVISVINLYTMVTVANNLTVLLKIGLNHNPLPVAIMYVVAFMLPYLYVNVSHILPKGSPPAPLSPAH